MAVTKTYQSIHFIELDTYIMVGGNKKLIQFRGGSLKPRIMGRYTTKDPDEIVALDRATRRPGASFKCIATEGAPDVVESPRPGPKPPAPPPGPTKEQSELQGEAPDQDEREDLTEATEGLKLIPEVTTVKAAREYLANNIEGLTLSRLPNLAAVKNAAEKNNIAFPNL